MEFDPHPSARKFIEHADRILVAKCTGSAARVVNELGGNIFTFTTFTVVEMVKGSLPPAFTIRVLGGTVGNVTVGPDDVPQFHAGEEVILFLGPDNQDGYPTLSPQGLYRTEWRPAPGGPIVTDPIYDLPLFRAGTRTPISPTTPSEPPTTVEDFVHSIRQALR